MISQRSFSQDNKSQSIIIPIQYGKQGQTAQYVQQVAPSQQQQFAYFQTSQPQYQQIQQQQLFTIDQLKGSYYQQYQKKKEQELQDSCKKRQDIQHDKIDQSQVGQLQQRNQVLSSLNVELRSEIKKLEEKIMNINEQYFKLEKQRSKEIQALQNQLSNKKQDDRENIINEQEQKRIQELEEEVIRLKEQNLFHLQQIENIEVMRIKEEKEIQGQYNSQILDVEQKTIQLQEQNKEIMDINEKLMQEIKTLRQKISVNNQLVESHKNQVEDLKTMWMKQCDEEVAAIQSSFENDKKILNQIIQDKENQNAHLVQQYQNLNNDYEELLSKHQTDLEECQETLKQVNEEYKAQLKNNEKELQQCHREIQNQKVAIDQFMEGNERIMKISDEKDNQIQQWREKYHNLISEHTTELQSIKNQFDIQKNIEIEKQLKIKINQFQQENFILGKNLQQQQNDNMLLQEEIERAKKQITEFRTNILELTKQLEAAQLKIRMYGDLEIKQKELDQSIMVHQDQLEDSHGKLRTIVLENQELNQALTVRIKEIQVWQTKYDSLQKSLNENMNQLRKDYEVQFESKIQFQQKEYEQQLNLQQMENQRLQNQYDNLMVQFKENEFALQNENNNLSNLLNDKNKEARTLHNKIQNLENELKNQERDMKMLQQQIQQQCQNMLNEQQQRKNFQMMTEKNAQEMQLSLDDMTGKYNSMLDEKNLLQEKLKQQQGHILEMENQIKMMTEEKNFLICIYFQHCNYYILKENSEKIQNTVSQRNDQINMLQTEKSDFIQKNNQFQKEINKLQNQLCSQQTDISNLQLENNKYLSELREDKKRLEEQITSMALERERTFLSFKNEKDNLQQQLLQAEDRHRMQLHELRRNLEREQHLKLKQDHTAYQDQINQLTQAIQQREGDLDYLKKNQDLLIKDNSELVRDIDEWRYRAVQNHMTGVKPFDLYGNYSGSGSKILSKMPAINLHNRGVSFYQPQQYFSSISAKTIPKVNEFTHIVNEQSDLDKKILNKCSNIVNKNPK